MPLPYATRGENPLRAKGHMPALHLPRMKATASQTMTFTLWCCLICLFAVIVAFGIDGGRMMPMFWATPLLFDLMRWWYRFGGRRWFFPQLRFLIAPNSLLMLLGVGLPMLAYLLHPAAWWGAAIGVLCWRMTRVSQKIRTHYFDYCVENEKLCETTRRDWKRRQSTYWLDDGQPPTPRHPYDSTAMKQRFERAVASVRGETWCATIYLLLAGIVAGLSMHALEELGYVVLREHAVTRWVAIGVLSIGLATTLILRPTGASLGKLWDATWHALLVFCHAPPSVSPGSRAPWSFRSRFGDAENRRAYLVWNAVLVTLLLLGVIVAYPLISDPWRDNRLGVYPVTGTLMGVRLLEVRYEREFVSQWGTVYFVGSWMAPPLFLASSLLALVGPFAFGARELFEGPDALEHEGAGAPGASTVP